MLTMSHNASERGSWKESYRSSDSVESSEDSDNSSTNSSLNGSSNRQNSNSHLPPPIGCITTHRVSAVIRPEIKIPPIDPLQFVKIQKNELSKTAVEQIKLAEEEKITKEKIKEVEEEWQNNLMSWKSKRKLTKNHSEDEALPRNPNRKTKTFSEILNEKAKSGARIGYNLHKYIDPDLEDDFNNSQITEFMSTKEEYLDEMTKTNGESNVSRPNMESSRSKNSNSTVNEQSKTKTNLDRFMEMNNSTDDMNMDKMSRNGLGEVVVFNTSLLEEFSVKSEQQQQCDIQQQQKPNKSSNIDKDDHHSKGIQKASPYSVTDSGKNDSPVHSDKKVHVPINDWKSSHQNLQQQQLARKYSSSNEDDVPNTQNSSFEIDDEEELDEELEKLRIDQERSFKAKLHTFEILAKQEEEAARRAAEANLKRQQNRAKLAAERSKSLSNINSQPKHGLAASSSVSSSSLQNKNANNNGNNDSSIKKSANNNKPIQNVNKPVNNINNNNEDHYYLTCKNQPTNSVVYNFKEKLETNTLTTIDQPQPQSSSSPTITATTKATIGQKSSQPLKIQTPKTQSSQPNQAMKMNEQPVINNKTTMNDSVERSQREQSSMNNIYENVPSLATNQHQHPTQLIHSNTASSYVHQQPPNVQSQTILSNEIIADPDAIRNASQKLLQQQQQIYQNQPPLQTTTTTTSIKHPSMVAPYPNDHYSNITSLHGKTGSYLHTISDDVGLPPIQITKSIQTTMPPASDDHHPVYQNQIITTSQTFHNYENSPETMMLPARDDLVSFYPPPEPIFQTQPQPSHYPLNPLYVNSQYLYYPKPYLGSTGNAHMMKPVPVSKQSTMPNNATRLPTTSRYGANGYNPNHWVIQEAELRQSTQRMHQPPPPPPPSSSSQVSNMAANNKNCPGYLSVSGKKKCSKCGDELGKGCAAMVVESLSLYYHINCFRCSVCNIQLGNGTVGTDVRVRNNKLHCQNCYSNDEAGLKFSRV
nr:putative uncharacterized protein DDB_G0277255 isoform X2 [Dermatophagoides farinae]